MRNSSESENVLYQSYNNMDNIIHGLSDSNTFEEYELPVSPFNDTILKHYGGIMKLVGFQNLLEPKNARRKFINTLYALFVVLGTIALFLYFTIEHTDGSCKKKTATYIWKSKLVILPIFGYAISFTLLRAKPEEATQSLAEKVFSHLIGPSRTFLCRRTLLMWIKLLLFVGTSAAALLLTCSLIRHFTRLECSLALLHHLVFDTVHCTICMHYTMHCLLIIFYARGLRLRILLQRTLLQEGQQDILDISRHVRIMRTYTVMPTIISVCNILDRIVTHYLSAPRTDVELAVDITSITLWTVIIAILVVVHTRLKSARSALLTVGAEMCCVPADVGELSADDISKFLKFLGSISISIPPLLRPAMVYIFGYIILSVERYMIQMKQQSNNTLAAS